MDVINRKPIDLPEISYSIETLSSYDEQQCQKILEVYQRNLLEINEILILNSSYSGHSKTVLLKLLELKKMSAKQQIVRGLFRFIGFEQSWPIIWGFTLVPPNINAGLIRQTIANLTDKPVETVKLRFKTVPLKDPDTLPEAIAFNGGGGEIINVFLYP